MLTAAIFCPFYMVFWVNEWIRIQCTFRKVNRFFEIENENVKYERQSIIQISINKPILKYCHINSFNHM